MFKFNDKINIYYNCEKLGIVIGSMLLKNDYNYKCWIKIRIYKIRGCLKVEYVEWYKFS